MTPLLVIGAMLVALPILVVQGPAHTTPLDVLNVLFLGVYWSRLLAWRSAPPLPLLVPFWLVLLGSLGGLYSAIDLGTGVLTVAQDVYLYLWFVTLVHFVASYCRPAAVVTVWIAVASTVTLLTLLDIHTGVLGGRLAGVGRAAGTFVEPNMFGNYLVVSFFLAWAGAAGGRPVLHLALPLLAAGVHATASNGSLLGLVGGTAAVVAVALLRDWRRAAGPLLVAAGLAIALVGASAGRLGELGLEVATRERGAIGGAALKGYSDRAAIWRDIPEIVRETPLGVGPGNLGDVRGVRSGNYHSAHNEYLGMLAERGPLGFVGWCGMLLGIAGWLRRRPVEADAAPSLAQAPLWGLLAAIAAHATVIELSHFRHVWLALAVVWVSAHPAAAAARALAPTLVAGLRPAAAEAS